MASQVSARSHQSLLRNQSALTCVSEWCGKRTIRLATFFASTFVLLTFGFASSGALLIGALEGPAAAEVEGPSARFCSAAVRTSTAPASLFFCSVVRERLQVPSPTTSTFSCPLWCGATRDHVEKRRPLSWRGTST